MPISGIWTEGEKGAANHFDLLVPRGTTIGGKVVDDAGHPVAGAVVLFSVPYNPAKVWPHQTVEIFGVHAKTDAHGNWIFKQAPADLKSIKIAAGSPGTDITFFEWPTLPERRGSRSVIRTGLRVGSEASLIWWETRLHDAGLKVEAIADLAGRATMNFEDPEGQRLSLCVDAGAIAQPWERSPVPAEHQLRGLGPITISVPSISSTDRVLREVMNMTEKSNYAPIDIEGASIARVYAITTAGGGADTELHVVEQPGIPAARGGAGAVHHVAFRTPTFDQYDDWAARLNELGLANSGPVDRFYFKSLYFREPGGVQFEIATDGPGFAADEPADQLGETLALPPFLEPRRAAIEAWLHPIA